MSNSNSTGIPTLDMGLFPEHRRELIEESAIHPDVIAERGYRSISRPTSADQRPRRELERLGFPGWSTREDYFYPGLWLPSWSPSGQKLPGQWKPKNAVSKDGKKMRYASAKSPVRLDVHPRWTRDRGTEDPSLVPAIQDPAIPLWITEGVKKADSLTSRDVCTVALSGVYNWRNTHATLGDWEDVRLKGREVWICFDADAEVKPAVATAMARLGKWLRSKGAVRVWYLVVPPAVNGSAVKGVDDYFAAGGNLKELERAAKPTPPKVTDTSDQYTDARLAETLAHEVLDGTYVWAAGLDWLGWDGKRWAETSDVAVGESVRQWALARFAEAAADMRDAKDGAAAAVDAWRTMCGASRQKTVLSLARGIVERRAEEFDADPDLLNTPDGVVDLRTKDLLPHDPDLLMTAITGGSYVLGFTHKDWTQALEALPADVADWMQVRVGQAVTGHTTSDGRLLLLQGGGENGKGTMFTDGLLPALGPYASVASPKLLMGSKNEHSTEMADLRGKRMVVAEELTEGRSIDVTALKRIADVGRIRARRTHKDNLEFRASHSLFATSNPIPVINETDHGTWRRLCMVRFPFRYMKPGERVEDPETQRRGDPTLKGRIMGNRSRQHDAIVTWVVEGAARWYASQAAIEAAIQADLEPPADVMSPPASVEADTLDWRRSADRVLGFWDECLIADPSSAVLNRELVEHFNAWLAENGHSPWTSETFKGRFGGHSITKTARVSFVRKARNVAGLRRRSEAGPYPGSHAERPVGERSDVYTGVRYRRPEDAL